ncbi:hypothetical protein DT076_16020 [Desertihabitans brevis]|uniref:Uncharacterized protein n=1 Tax=Desertihabitans brevis TaxID=2268447 RepID=A0A367YRQ4_9ACTN|nr:hypothetical protein [Desertihabitans brevis]RCK68427.1 hypothetical protein DT076_16020 [Desertihabitans brevis]
MSAPTTGSRVRLAEVAQLVEQAAADVDDVQRILETRVDTLISATDTGAVRSGGAATFLRAFTDFDAQLSRVQDGLAEVHRHLTGPGAA